MKEKTAGGIVQHLLRYSGRRTLYPLLLLLGFLTGISGFGFLRTSSGFPAVLCVILLVFSYFALCTFLYRNLVRAEARVRQALPLDSHISSHRMLDQLMTSYEEMHDHHFQQQLLQKQALIQALQNQINPHFLYNTLDSIRGQALEEGSREIADMLGTLSAFFRYTVSSKQDEVSIEQELRNVENYMKIQRYRYDNRLSLYIETPGEMDLIMRYQIPKLILQPIVENAIVHGLSNSYQGGIVSISFQLADDLLLISVSDNGKGIPEEQLQKINHELNSSDPTSAQGDTPSASGIALQNVSARIKLRFGERYGLHLFSVPGFGTKVEITLPLGETACHGK